MNIELIRALEEVEKAKGISKELIIETVEAALVSAYKKNFPDSEKVTANMDRKTGEIKIFNLLTVVEEYSGDGDEMLIEEALELDKNYKLGDTIQIEVQAHDFGRIAAQSAKQVVIQRIKEAERSAILEEYINRVSELVTGVVHRKAKDNIFVDLGKIEGVLLIGDQVPKEVFQQNDRIKAVITSVQGMPKGPQITLSRSTPELVKRLFELEVPEIHDGTVEIKSVSREAGYRTKIAVYSVDPNKDALGACVGQRGSRVQAVVDELRGEKIDIINYSKDPSVYIANALSPSDVVYVNIIDEERKVALVVVPDNQLSLAIGKEGQNARLAARLTGWKIDIKSESQMEQNYYDTGEYSEYDEEYEDEKLEEYDDEKFYGDYQADEDYSDSDYRYNEDADDDIE